MANLSLRAASNRPGFLESSARVTCSPSPPLLPSGRHSRGLPSLGGKGFFLGFSGPPKAPPLVLCAAGERAHGGLGGGGGALRSAALCACSETHRQRRRAAAFGEGALRACSEGRGSGTRSVPARAGGGREGRRPEASRGRRRGGLGAGAGGGARGVGGRGHGRGCSSGVVGRVAGAAAAVGARRGAGVVRAVGAGRGAAGGVARAVAGAAHAGAAPAALPLAGRPALGRRLLLRGAARLRRAGVGLRGAGRALRLRQHELLLLDRGRRPRPLPLPRPRRPRPRPRPGPRPPGALPRRQLGSSPCHHSGSRCPEEDWLRCLRGVRRLVLDRHRGGGSGPLDAPGREAVGVPGLLDTARLLHPHTETHQSSARSALRIPPHLVEGPRCPSKNFDSRQEVNPDSGDLHCSPHLEHCPICAGSLWFSFGPKPVSGGPSRRWEHVPRRGQLHHVCVLHTGGPEQAFLLPVLPAIRRLGVFSSEPTELPTESCAIPQRLGVTGWRVGRSGNLEYLKFRRASS